MDPDHTARADASRPGLRPEAGTVRTIANGQLAFLEDLLAMNVGDRRLRGGHQIQPTERGPV